MVDTVTMSAQSGAQLGSLLAKWRTSYGTEDLSQWRWARGHVFGDHVSECLRMAVFLFDEVPFARALHERMRLPVSVPDFRRAVLVALVGHDLGKGANEFQTMLGALEHAYQIAVRSGRPFERPRLRQAVRHEWLSAVLMWRYLLEWGEDQVGSALWARAVAAAAGHHLKGHHGPRGQDDHIVVVYGGRINKHLANIGRFGLRALPRIPNARATVERLTELHDEMEESPGFAGQTDDGVAAAIKWTVILCDTLASLDAPPGVEPRATRVIIQAWLQRLFEGRSIDFAGRLDPAVCDTPRDFQIEAAEVVNDLLVQVSCGGGKSAAALLAAATRPSEPLVFTTPLTSASAQLFKDYGDFGRDGLRTGRAAVDRRLDPDLARWLQPTPSADSAEEVAEEREAEALMRAFGDLQHEVVYGTVDQVLGLLSYSRSSVLWLLYLVRAQVVFDEFHAYDARLDGWLQRFMELFSGMRCIFLSGTVTPHRAERVREGRPGLTIITSREPVDPADAARYVLHWLGDDVGSARNVFEEQARALWIVNQVRRAQDLGRDMGHALVYHSRFRYRDRVGVHRTFVGAFRSDQPSVRGIATQVAEMSLDLSASVMITEICPFDALIQRLGRCNRADRFPERPADVYLYAPETPHPYVGGGREDAVERSEELVRGLAGHPVSQRQLDEALASLSAETDPIRPVCPLLRTMRQTLRDSQPQSVTALLPDDLPVVRAHPWRIQEFEFPMWLPMRRQQVARRHRHRFIVDGQVDPRLGILVEG